MARMARRRMAPGKARASRPGRRLPARKAAPKTKRAQVALIKSVIAREEETKFRSELIVNSVAYNSQITTSDIIRLLPKLVQGQPNSASSIYEREGMRISPRALKIDAEVCLTAVDRSRAIQVVYWVLQSKQVKQTALLSTNIIPGSDLLKTGDSSNVQGFNGYVEDVNLPINDARYVVLKKGSFKLGCNTGTIQDNTTAGNQPLGGQAVSHRLSFKLPVPAKFVYDQDENTPRTVYYPNGYAPFMLFGYYHQNQTVPDVSFQDMTISLRSSLWYDDA